MPGARTGVGSYTWNLITRLPATAPDTTFVAWYLDLRAALGIDRRGRLFEDVRAPNLVDRRMPIPSRWFDRVALRLDAPRLERMVRFDVLFAPNFVPPPTRSRGVVLTIHDLAFRRFPETAPMATHRWLARLEASLRTASQVIVVSERTRSDLIESYPRATARLADRLTVVPLGVDPSVFRPRPAEAVETVRRRFAIDGPFLLSLGGIEPRKNLPALIRAYASLPEGVRPSLVLAGPVAPWNPEGWNLVRPTLEALPHRVRARIVVTGYVSEDDKVALLSGAEALVYPSLYEGFGLPVIEAMACGTPVLTSDVSALPETAGDAALLVDPHATDDIAAGMERLLTDTTLRERLRAAGVARAAGFSWDETARLTAEVLRRGNG
ncbi:MAG: glycosyltransferase family 4 protein [Actinomycetota bacterium]